MCFTNQHNIDQIVIFCCLVLGEKNQQITTIPIDQIKIQTPEIKRLLFEESNSFVQVEVEAKKANKKELTAVL
jgi:hypothetical protein